MNRLLIIFFGFFLFAEHALSEITESQPIHHFFNARLLQPEEKQISIVGNAKMGVSENFELGTQGALLLFTASPNIAVKHRMFRREGFETSFTGHAFYLQMSGTPSEDDESIEGSSTEKKKEKRTYFFFPFGVVTTFDLSPGKALSAGILDVYLYSDSTDLHTSMRLHIFTPVVAYDHVLKDDWGFSAILAYPIYLRAELESDVLDTEGSMNLLSGVKAEDHPILGFLTMTRSVESLNIEFGAIVFGQTLYPYANIFWRWK